MTKTKQKLKDEKIKVSLTEAEKKGKRLSYNKIKEQEAYKLFKKQAIIKAKKELGSYKIDKLQDERLKKIKKLAEKKAKQQLFQEQLQKTPIRTSTQQLAKQEAFAQQRQKKIELMGSRAEQLEIEAVSFNEIPMLHDMERQRTRLTSPPNRSMTRIITDTTNSFPQ